MLPLLKQQVKNAEKSITCGEQITFTNVFYLSLNKIIENALYTPTTYKPGIMNNTTKNKLQKVNCAQPG